MTTGRRGSSETGAERLGRAIQGAGLCSLSPAALADRVATIRREIVPHIRSSVVLEDGVAWTFPAEPVWRERLEGIVALERECCGEALDFRIGADPADGSPRLEIRARTDAGCRALEAAGTPSTPSAESPVRSGS